MYETQVFRHWPPVKIGGISLGEVSQPYLQGSGAQVKRRSFIELKRQSAGAGDGKGAATDGAGHWRGSAGGRSLHALVHAGPGYVSLSREERL